MATKNQTKYQYVSPLQRKQNKWQWLKKMIAHKVPISILLFALIWVFSAFVYDDVFYMSQQFSYFAFDTILLKEVFYLPIAPMVWTGRLFLVLFKYPILGGFVYALVLTLIPVLIGYIFQLKNLWKLVSVVPFVWICVLMSFGLDIFFKYEPSFVCSYPVIALLVLGLIALGVRFTLKYKFIAYLKSFKNDDWKWNYLTAVVLIAVFAGMCDYVYTRGENNVYTCRMQRMLEDEQWEDMIELAQKAKNVSRPVAAYYAIALVQTDQLNEKLFDVYYQYPELKLTNRTGNPDIGYFLFEPDITLYSGLLNASYHENMEHLVSSGLQVYRLRHMFIASLLNGEKQLAYKYLNALDKAPFEQKFVQKYKPMLYDDSKIANDPMLARIADMYPRIDAVEEQFDTPLFIGYYKRVNRGSKRIMLNSMAASLYTKDINDFMGILPAFMNEASVPRTFDEALIVNALQNKNRAFLDQLPMQITGPVKTMLQIGQQMDEDHTNKEIGLALKKEFLGMYSYYFYYQNIRDENEMYIDGKGANDKEVSKVN